MESMIAFFLIIIGVVFLGLFLVSWAVRNRIRNRKNMFNSSPVQPIPQPVSHPIPSVERTSVQTINIERPPLPVACPGCGGQLADEEIRWLDRNTAECPYCGRAVRGL
jgi:uncharacterized Zn-finger protein